MAQVVQDAQAPKPVEEEVELLGGHLEWASPPPSAKVVVEACQELAAACTRRSRRRTCFWQRAQGPGIPVVVVRVHHWIQDRSNGHVVQLGPAEDSVEVLVEVLGQVQVEELLLEVDLEEVELHHHHQSTPLALTGYLEVALHCILHFHQSELPCSRCSC